MSKTENYTHYVCDRCGDDAYIAENAAAASDWREVERFDQYGTKTARLLCKTCTDAYKKLAAEQDLAFKKFMDGKEQ